MLYVMYNQPFCLSTPSEPNTGVVMIRIMMIVKKLQTRFCYVSKVSLKNVEVSTRSVKTKQRIIINFLSY